MLNKGDKILLLGGHLTPALALIDELKQRGYFNLHWAGTKYSQTSDKHISAEYQVITQKGINFHVFTAGKLWRKWTLPTLYKGMVNLFLIPAGFIKAFLLLSKEKPKLIISFGGYLALPIVIAGNLLKITIVTHEQTLSPGLANKIISRFVNRIFISWQETYSYFPRSKTIYTGNPLRKEVFRIGTHNYVFNNNLPIIYVTGGNQGANTINWRLIKILPLILAEANIIHQTGNSSLTQDFSQALALKQSLPDELKQRYIVKENIFGEEIGEVFAKADLLVSRSGANTITEILALGKLAILIPLPWSSHHEQLKNAQIVGKTGLAQILQQYDRMPPQEMYEAITAGLKHIQNNTAFDGRPYKSAAKDAKELINLSAQSQLADEIEKLF